jgi:hypothetical protein
MIHQEHLATLLLDGSRDPLAVLFAKDQGSEDEQAERAPQERHAGVLG